MTQIGTGHKIIDQLGLLMTTLIVLVVTVIYFSYFIELLPLYICLIAYIIFLNKKYYIFFDGQQFLIETAFRTRCIDASFYDSVSITSFEKIFAPYVTINFKDGQSFRFMSDTNDIDVLDRRIRNLMSEE